MNFKEEIERLKKKIEAEKIENGGWNMYQQQEIELEQTRKLQKMVKEKIDELIGHFKTQKQADSYEDEVLEFNGVMKNMIEFKKELGIEEDK